jgi:AAA domain
MSEETQRKIDALVTRLRATQGEEQPEGAPSNGHSIAAVGPATDEAIIRKCRAAKNAAKFSDLFDAGDVHSYHGGDDSVADLALLGILAYWTQDEAQLERLFSASALGQRSKWRNRSDYRRRTIRRALPKPGHEVYDWSKEGGRLLSSSANPPRGISDDDNNEDDLDGIIWLSEQGEPKDREYLIESVAVKKYTIVAYGAGGVAKSFAVLAAGIAIAGGVEEWLGLQVLDHGYVLYLDFELDAEEQHRRVRDLCAGMGVDIPKKLAYFSALGMTTEQAFKKARAFVKKYEAKAVIIDSMGLAMAGDMDRAKDVIAFHRQFTDPLRALGTTPFVVDHEGKLQAGENRKEKGPTGSAFKSWTTRSVLQFILEEYDEATSSLNIRVRQHKTNFKPTKPFGVRFTFGERKVSVEPIELPDTELVDEVYVPVKDRIVAALAPGEATIRELAELTGAETGTIRNKISELKGEGAVIDAGYRGREKLYSLPDKDSSLLSSSSNPYRESSDDDNEKSPRERIVSMLDNPPDWLPRQLEMCREEPERWTKPICSAIATHVFGDALRWQEVKPVLEAHLYQEPLH